MVLHIQAVPYSNVGLQWLQSAHCHSTSSTGVSRLTCSSQSGSFAPSVYGRICTSSAHSSSLLMVVMWSVAPVPVWRTLQPGHLPSLFSKCWSAQAAQMDSRRNWQHGSYSVCGRLCSVNIVAHMWQDGIFSPLCCWRHPGHVPLPFNPCWKIASVQLVQVSFIWGQHRRESCLSVSNDHGRWHTRQPVPPPGSDDCGLVCRGGGAADGQ